MEKSHEKIKTHKRPPAHKKPLEFSYATKSFIGYLEGSGKSLNTIESYRSDLNAFQRFLEGRFGKGKIELKKLALQDLEDYQADLKAKSFRTNTRRRKLLTVRRFFDFLKKRNRIQVNIGEYLPAPDKVERIPLTVPYFQLMTHIKKLPMESPIERRNQLLLWFLAETGCLVSEIPRLKFQDFSKVKSDCFVFFVGKNERKIKITKELYSALLDFKKEKKSETLFLGHNKYGSLGSAISDRGVELLVKGHSRVLGFDGLTPRRIRHSAVLGWFRQGMSELEIQGRLGLKTDYSFRVYMPLLKSGNA